MKTKVREGGGRNPSSLVEDRERASSWVSVGQPTEVNTPHKELNERSVFKPESYMQSSFCQGDR